MKDSFCIKGKVKIEVFNSNGELKEEQSFDNLVTTAGKNFIARKLVDQVDSERIFSIGIGSGSTAANVADTELETELANVENSYNIYDELAANKTVHLTRFGQGVGTGTISEVGLFTNADPKVLVCRAIVGTPIVKDADEIINISWELTVG